MSRKEVWTAEVKVRKQTEKALLVEPTQGMYEAVWIPRSMIEEPEDYDFVDGEEIEISIPLWKAEEVGFA